MTICCPGDSGYFSSNHEETLKGTSRQRPGKGAIRKKIPSPKTEVGKNQTNKTHRSYGQLLSQ